MVKIYKECVKKYVAGFKHGRTSLVGDPREGRPKTPTTDENIEKGVQCGSGIAVGRYIKIINFAGLLEKRIRKIKGFKVRILGSFWLLYIPKFNGKPFGSNEELTVAIDGYFADLPESYFKDGIHLLEKRWTKCIELINKFIFDLKNAVIFFGITKSTAKGIISN